MGRERKRSILYAIDLRDLSSISADALSQNGLEFCQHVRRRATLARSSDAPIVCGRCGWPVYLTKNGLTKEYLWAHFASSPGACDWFTGAPSSADRVSARQFLGIQESPLHYRLKYEIADLLTADPAATDVRVDTRLQGQNGFRVPDVRVTYQGRPVAFEIQLSNTQLPIILERETFYRAEGRELIWLTWTPDLRRKADLAQAFLDIVTAHNDNLFSVDDETIQLSRSRKQLTLKVHWWETDWPQSKFVTLNDLTYPSDALPFAIDKPQPWHVCFKRRWLSITTPRGSDWRDRKYLLGELVRELDLEVTDTELNLDYEVEALLCMLLSLECSKVVGSRQRSLTEMLHTFLTTANRKPLARVVEFAARASGNGHLFNRPKTRELYGRAIRVGQVDRQSVEARIARALFPRWAERSLVTPKPGR